MKGIVNNKMLRGVENKHKSRDSEWVNLLNYCKIHGQARDNFANRNIPVVKEKESKSDSRCSGKRNGSSLNFENKIVGK